MNGVWSCQQRCWRCSPLGWETRSPSGQRPVSVRGRRGHTPCVDVPGGQILVSTSASKELMGESCGLTVEMERGHSKLSFPQPHCVRLCLLREQGSPRGVCCPGSGANSPATEVVLMGISLYFWHHLLLSLITDARRD